MNVKMAVFSGENFTFSVMNVKTAVFSGENLIFYLDYGQMPNTCVLRRELKFFVMNFKTAVFLGENFTFFWITAKCQTILFSGRELYNFAIINSSTFNHWTIVENELKVRTFLFETFIVVMIRKILRKSVQFQSNETFTYIHLKIKSNLKVITCFKELLKNCVI